MGTTRVVDRIFEYREARLAMGFQDSELHYEGYGA